MKIDSVCERLKLWAERGIAQEITIHISREGSIHVHKKDIIKNEQDLNAVRDEGIAQWHEIA